MARFTSEVQIQTVGKHWFLQIIFFENSMGISVSFISVKKKKNMLGWMQKQNLIQIIKPLIKYPNCVARRQI